MSSLATQHSFSSLYCTCIKRSKISPFGVPLLARRWYSVAVRASHINIELLQRFVFLIPSSHWNPSDRLGTTLAKRTLCNARLLLITRRACTSRGAASGVPSSVPLVLSSKEWSKDQRRQRRAQARSASAKVKPMAAMRAAAIGTTPSKKSANGGGGGGQRPLQCS